MPTTGGPGQQAIPKAIRAMPVTRAIGIATPVSCSPNNACPTSDGTISNANPAAASPMAAKISTFFIVPITLGLDDTWSFARNGRKLLTLRFLLRFELEGELVDLASELERNIVAILHPRHPRPG